jgi:putative (di)nucleoside polyphosphate hydrolase
VAKYPVDRLSERQWSLLLETYIDRQRLMVSNEDMGERRFQVLMTVVGAVGIALGLVAGQFDVAALQATALLMALLLTALGYATTMRVARRDVTTSRLKSELLEIREFVATGRPDLVAVLPYMAEKPAGLRTRPLYPSGGLVDLVAMVTAAFAGIAVGTLVGGRVDNVVTLMAAVAAATLAWLGMAMVVRRVYRSAGILRASADAPSVRPEPGPRAPDPVRLPPRFETFRANVGIVVHDGRNRVLVFERSGRPGSWQFPQGGIEPGEDRREAAWRELREETGLTEANVRFDRDLGRWLSYEIPNALRSEKTGMGQTQWWFLARLTGDGRIPPIPNGEFARCEWVSWDAAVDRVVDFKRPVYAELARAFAPSSST